MQTLAAKESSSRWSKESPTGLWVFRSPFEQLGAWRVRCRNSRTGEVICRTIDGARSLEDARELVVALALKAEDEPTPEPTDATTRTKVALAEAVKEYLDSREVSSGTLNDYKLCLENVVLPTFENDGLLTVRDIKYKHITALFTKTAKERKWTARNKQKYLFVLRSFFKECIKRGYTSENPAAIYELPKNVTRAVRQSRARGIALTEDQARKLLQNCKDPFVAKSDKGVEFRKVTPPNYLHLAVMIALRTGLRRGNIIGLRVEHLKNDLTEIDIPAAEMKNRERLRIPVHPELRPRPMALTGSNPGLLTRSIPSA